MIRKLTKTGLAISLVFVLAIHLNPLCNATEDTVKIGVLHSLTGTMAISETSLRDAVLMAVDEINARGGVLGKRIEPVVVDPASDWDLFPKKAKELLVKEKVLVVFGCWTSISRKKVLPVFEKQNGLLFYPVQYEGQEMSPNIIYTGATPNQQLIPAAEFLLSDDGGNRKKFFLLGTDYVFPRTANRILKGFLLAKGIPEENIMEEYYPFEHKNYKAVIDRIAKFAEEGDACVLSTLNGNTNVFFYDQFEKKGLRADDCPIMAFSIAEDELRNMDTKNLVGHLCAWNYYQSLDSPENRKFVSNFKKYCKEKGLPGGNKRVTDDPIEAAYFGVHVWKDACEKAGSFDVDKVIPAIMGLEFDAPGGRKKMHPKNHHTYKPVYVGEIRSDGQFDIIWEAGGLVEPKPFGN
ncbi:MAG: urea ABC transporter substrate-binding protein [Desulfobacteraceae bacterium]|uniref:Urea ABC transporter substrate-binding protein n=1 Tax=Candidatus Desulfacyla euxinica TaxID=2841693 RepID=A0A8J6T917_9DELT|nr:urea ABC transporter substrate-binding protein [Candidatus Desulfacyla euxinica]MBL6977619.1 urea ABC transporter substrate-binding protein [Desulfobacteraceae bacterium]MBL7216206.1 urea ABC transporter substrate-binding protein [Desulfobacteraceae bacterium]